MSGNPFGDIAGAVIGGVTGHKPTTGNGQVDRAITNGVTDMFTPDSVDQLLSKEFSDQKDNAQKAPKKQNLFKADEIDKLVKRSEKNGDPITVTPQTDGTYTFTTKSHHSYNLHVEPEKGVPLLQQNLGGKDGHLLISPAAEAARKETAHEQGLNEAVVQVNGFINSKAPKKNAPDPTAEAYLKKLDPLMENGTIAVNREQTIPGINGAHDVKLAPGHYTPQQFNELVGHAAGMSDAQLTRLQTATGKHHFPTPTAPQAEAAPAAAPALATVTPGLREADAPVHVKGVDPLATVPIKEAALQPQAVAPITAPVQLAMAEPVTVPGASKVLSDALPAFATYYPHPQHAAAAQPAPAAAPQAAAPAASAPKPAAPVAPAAEAAAPAGPVRVEPPAGTVVGSAPLPQPVISGPPKGLHLDSTGTMLLSPGFQANGSYDPSKESHLKHTPKPDAGLAMITGTPNPAAPAPADKGIKLTPEADAKPAPVAVTPEENAFRRERREITSNLGDKDVRAAIVQVMGDKGEKGFGVDDMYAVQKLGVKDVDTLKKINEAVHKLKESHAGPASHIDGGHAGQSAPTAGMVKGSVSTER